MARTETSLVQDLILYAASAALSCLVLFVGLKQLDPNREISKKAIEHKKELSKRLGRPLIHTNPYETISYMAERVVGSGSFGVVFQAKCLESGETVAIKKVLQDRRYKNRELQLMRSMEHPNVVCLKHCFFSTTSRNELFLNLVMEYVPETVYRVLKHYSNMNQRMPLIYVKLYTYQIFRGLAYIHPVPGVCHRDVKPQNLLVDPLTHEVKLCDFGSAKILDENSESSLFLEDAETTFQSIKTLSQSDGRWRYNFNGAESSTYAAGLALESLAGVISLASSELDESMVGVAKNDIRKLFETLEKYGTYFGCTFEDFSSSFGS